MAMTLDPRLHAVRSDLADAALKGRVDSTRFAEGRLAHVRDGLTVLRRKPFPDAPADTELLRGEPVSVFDQTPEGWAWVQSQSDRYVGWCSSDALAFSAPAATHVVRILSVHLYPAPDIKITPVAFAPMNARLCVVETSVGSAGGSAGGAAGNADRFCRLACGHFVVAHHLTQLGSQTGDMVDTARMFRGAPYLWAGRSVRGIDCSGLVQMALHAIGQDAPRDSDMQEAGLGTAVSDRDPLAWQRGDLVFWKGHVGIVSAPGTLLHANAFHMATAEEPLVPALDRIAAAGLQVTSVRRLTPDQ